MASKTTRVVAGVYEINGSLDRDGRPYRAERANPFDFGGNPNAVRWNVTDSRGRVVSRHATKGDAVASVDVEAGK